jgi:hypothetical protein
VKNQIEKTEIEALKKKYGLTKLTNEQVTKLIRQLNQFAEIILASDPPNKNL